MSPRDALADGRLADAVALQQAIVLERPDDPAARLFLFELLTLAGRLREARDELRLVTSDDPAWPSVRRDFLRLLKAEHVRSHRHRRPLSVDKEPAHFRRRWKGIVALRQERGDAAEWFDRADVDSPLIAGHVDGREFDGMRDTDDRFGSVFEALVGPEYIWLPFEDVRRLTLAPSVGALDAAFRPARVLLANGGELDVVLPLLYPGSHADDGTFAVGLDTDWRAAGGSVTCGVGARVLLVGEDEVSLGECKQFELRVV
jgi:type VI secretion system protein ImpE